MFLLHYFSSALKKFQQYYCTFHLATLVYCCVGVYHIVILFNCSFTQHVVDTWYRGDLVSVWSNDKNAIILNVGVLLILEMDDMGQV